MKTSEKIFWNALNLFPKFGPAHMDRLTNCFKNPEEAWRENGEKLIRAGVNAETVKEFLIWRENINPEKEYEIIERENIKIIARDGDDYPRLLREIPFPPSLLYVKGKIPADPAIAVVGSRLATGHGIEAASRFAGELAARGFTIISGLALGIDTAAHQAALEIGGKTVAVLGGGLDEPSIYPAQNKELSRQIIKRAGAVISEFPCLTQPFPYHFPQRNRIVSGLSLGVLVIEAREKSGALITANLALQQNREVFALPGRIASQNSAGANKLIQQGAKLVMTVDDILEELNLEIAPPRAVASDKKTNWANLPKDEKNIAESLIGESLEIDRIIETTKLAASEALAALTMLEIKGIVKKIDGKYALK